jgi:hypothetical protein
MPGVKSKRTVKDESDEEEFKPAPDVKDEEADTQEEPIKKDENVDESVSSGTRRTTANLHLLLVG